MLFTHYAIILYIITSINSLMQTETENTDFIIFKDPAEALKLSEEEVRSLLENQYIFLRKPYFIKIIMTGQKRSWKPLLQGGKVELLKAQDL